MLTPLQFLITGLAAFAAGFVNALAGGGTLITFPLLVFFGIPAVTANVTNTVALCPGYFGATLAQRNELVLQKNRLWLLIPAAMIGGLVGAMLLLFSGERLFSGLIPWLILLASLLLACGEEIKQRLQRTNPETKNSPKLNPAAGIPVALAAVYGGYFGAGLSVIFLAVLGMLYRDSLTRLNAMKQALALAANVAAAVVFVFSGRVDWWVAFVMAGSALAGGAAGGRLAGAIPPAFLRWLVVVIGLAIAILYFIR